MKATGTGKPVDPAYAGMILTGVNGHIIADGGPRVCGDDPTVGRDTNYDLTWTPRMRG